MIFLIGPDFIKYKLRSRIQVVLQDKNNFDIHVLPGCHFNKDSLFVGGKYRKHSPVCQLNIDYCLKECMLVIIA